MVDSDARLRGRRYYPEQEQATAPAQVSQMAPVNTLPAREISRSQQVPRYPSASCPRPTERHDEYTGVHYSTGEAPPPVGAQYTCVERGVSSPRFLRFTSSCCAVDSNTQKNISVPLACVWQPFARQADGEQPIPLVESAPYRCTRCMAYANPFFKVIDVRKWQCNICGMTQDRPEKFWTPNLNPELTYGTYEFVAPKDYINRPASDPIFFIVLEATAFSIGSLALPQVVLNSVKSLLDLFPFPQRSRVGVVSYGTELVFYKPNKKGEVVEVVVADVLDPFVPDHPSALSFQVTDDRDLLEYFFDSVIAVLSSRQAPACVSMASVCSALNSLLAPTGGRALIFSSLLGTVGLNPLKARDDPKLYSTEREKELFTPQFEKYSAIGREAAEAGVCFDIFCLGSSYQDTASLSTLSSLTGGDLHYFPRFNPSDDNEKLHFTIANILARPQAFSPLMRARVSNQLSISEYIGHYTRKGPLEMVAGAIDADKSIAILLTHDEKMTQGNPAYIQCAVLYVSLEGRWLLRVFNGVVTPYIDLNAIYSTACPDTIANVLSRVAVNKLQSTNMKTIREAWHKELITMCQTYRTVVTASSTPQMLPESLKHIALYVNCTMKLMAFSMSRPNPDLRMASAFLIKALPVSTSQLMYYPRIYRLHDILEQPQQPGTLTQTQTVALPSLVPDNAESFEESGVYLIYNGEQLILYAGADSDEGFINDAFGVSKEDLETYKPTDLGTEVSSRVYTVIEEIRRISQKFLPFTVVKSDHRVFISPYLIEEATPSEMAYNEYLFQLNRIVTQRAEAKS